MLHAACCMLHAVCCMLCAVCLVTMYVVAIHRLIAHFPPSPLPPPMHLHMARVCTFYVPSYTWISTTRQYHTGYGYHYPTTIRSQIFTTFVMIFGTFAVYGSINKLVVAYLMQVRILCSRKRCIRERTYTKIHTHIHTDTPTHTRTYKP
jgi:hypothetical protein